MEDDTPRDQSPPESIAQDRMDDATPQGLHSRSPEAPIPLARPATTGKPLSDADLLLFPLSRKQAIADVGLILLLAFISDFMIGFALAFVIPVVYGIPLDSLEELPAHVRKGLLFPMLAMRAAITMGLVGVFVWCRRQPLGAIGLRKRGLALDGTLGIALTVVVYGLIFAAIMLLTAVWPSVLDQMQENATGLLDMLPNASPFVFLLMAITIGVYEEILFRGFMMPRLRRATGSWIVAVILSSCIFTALHAMEQTPAALVIVAILSVSFSVVTIWRRSIVPAIVAHALFDFSQFLLLMYQQGGQ